MPSRRPSRAGPRAHPAPTAREADLDDAVMLLALAVRCEAYAWEAQPISGDFAERWQWLRTALRPLAARSTVIAEVVEMLDPATVSPVWDDRRRMRRLMARLAKRL